MRRSLLGTALLLTLPAAEAAAVTPSSPTSTPPPVTTVAKADAAQSLATYCPRPLHRATRLIIVTVPSMTSANATLHTFERRSPADATWMRAGPPETAVVGTAGIGWSASYTHLAKKDEAIKQEGDKRTPAGVFRVAGPFGFDSSKLAGYTQLTKDNSFCVDDPTSSLYGKIVGKGLAKLAKSSENMSSAPGLKRGMIVDYPARRGAKAGSCIFVQVWDGQGVGTNARIGMAEDRLTVLQKWSAQGFTTIAIMSEDAVVRMKGCLPLNSAAGKYEQKAVLPLPHPRRDKEQRAELAR